MDYQLLDTQLTALDWRVQALYRRLPDMLLSEDHCLKMYEYEFTRKSQHPHYSNDSQ